MTILLVTSVLALTATTDAASGGVSPAVKTAQRDRQVLRFFARHPWLLTDPRFSTEAHRQVRAHRLSLAAALRRVAVEKRLRRKRLTRRLAQVRAAETPAVTICRVFGPGDCQDAVRVARCESGLHTDAVNGQYLGLFQMGWKERQLFGHGSTAEQQSRAALRYFVASGRDWSPWSCRPR
jgi:hypothetical protein